MSSTSKRTPSLTTKTSINRRTTAREQVIQIQIPCILVLVYMNRKLLE